MVSSGIAIICALQPGYGDRWIGAMRSEQSMSRLFMQALAPWSPRDGETVAGNPAVATFPRWYAE